MSQRVEIRPIARPPDRPEDRFYFEAEIVNVFTYTTPVLAFASLADPSNDNTQAFNAEIFEDLESNVIRLVGTFGSATVSAPFDIDSSEGDPDDDFDIPFTTGAIDDGVCSFKCRVETAGGSPLSDWSNTVTKTIDTVAPTITSSATANNAENSVLAHSLTANESVTWALNGGDDEADFEISGSTLRWLSNGTKDYEVPDDTGTNNVYNVTVRATDTAGNTTDQNIAITVTDVADAASPILDTYTSAYVALSAARKLRTAYAGNVMEVQRTNDSTNADIGFSGTDLDEAALATHVSSNTGVIKTWYDQSGNARNPIGASTNAFWPQIVNAGTIRKVNSKPTIFFENSGSKDSLYNGSGLWAADASCTFLIVADRSSAAASRAMIGGTAGALEIRFKTDHTIEVIRESLALIFTTTTVAPQQLCAIAVVIDDAGTSSVKINGNAAETFTTDVTQSAPNTLIGGMNKNASNLATGDFFDAGISEIIMWPTAFNDTDRDAIVADAMTYYGIS